LNSKIATILPAQSQFHIFPSPGDSGSAIGAVLAGLNRHVKFFIPYLGSPVDNSLSAEDIVNELLTNGVVGVVQGRAEFGPRALGNRSLLADPRHPSMKEKLNQIKKREEFRPFAPVIQLEDLSQNFEIPLNITSSPYMQYVMKVILPDLMPAITHVDGTARVQTLSKETNPLLYQVLELWKQKTGCPVLVNTSLNIKGEPLVNATDDARKFEERYGIKVLY
jgi:carbamoyltransferase